MTLSLNKTGIYPHSANIMASLNKKNRIGDLLQTKKLKQWECLHVKDFA